MLKIIHFSKSFVVDIQKQTINMLDTCRIGTFKKQSTRKIISEKVSNYFLYMITKA